MGAIVNGIAIVITALVGNSLHAGIPDKIQKPIMQGIGLVVLCLGIDGVIGQVDAIIMTISLVVGILIGESLDIDHWVINGIEKLEAKYQQKDTEVSLAQGFIAASMIFCIGSMVIVGSLESGLTGNHSTLYTKSMLDGIVAFILASNLGFGVVLSAIPVFVIEGGLTLVAAYVAPMLSATVISQMISVGSVLLIALSLNMLDLTKFKLMNFAPAIFVPIGIEFVMSFF